MVNANLIIVGKLGASYGIRGWIKIFSFTENKENLFDYTPLYIKVADQWTEIVIESFKTHGQDLIVKIKGIETREAAAKLTNQEIYTDEKMLPSLGNDDFYWKDLMGCEVVNLSGYNFGTVTELLETGSNDVLVVKANLKDAFGQKERLIPFIQDDFIKEVHLAEKRIIVDWDPAF